MRTTTASRLPRSMFSAGMAYLDYLRVDCSMDLNTYLDEDVLEILFVKMVSVHLAESAPLSVGCAAGPDPVRA